MSATNYTPISLYYSTTAAAVPLAANLVNGELAINITDGKIYYKDNAGTVQLFGSKSDLTTISFGTTGLTPSTATGGAVTVAGTLITSNGGTGLSSYTAGDITYYASGTALTKLGIGTAGQILTSSGTAPQWSTLSGVAVTTFSAGTTGLTPSSATSGAITLAGTLITSNGGTGLSSYTAGDLVYYATGTALSKLGIGTSNYVLTSSGSAPQWSQNLSIGSLTASADSTFSSTGALTISKGTTLQQPGSPVTGMMRYNTTTNQFEGYSGSSPAWKSIGGSALSNDTSTASNLYPVFAAATTGTAENLYTSNAQYLYKPSTGELSVKAPVAANGIVVNSTTVSSNYTIASGYNGFSVGPISVSSGVSVTVASGQVWVTI